MKKAVILIPVQAGGMRRALCMKALCYYHDTERELRVLVSEIAPYGVVRDEVSVYDCRGQPLLQIKSAV